MAYDELYCFFDRERMCGPDCMAYKTVPDDNVQLDSSQVHCVLISSAERAGRSLNIIGSILNDISKRQKRKDDDHERARNIGSAIPPVGDRR